MVKKKVKKKELECKPEKPRCKTANCGLCKPYLPIILIIVALLALNLVNLGQGFVMTGHAAETGTSYIADLFASWTAGDLDVNIAKYLFFGMLTLLIFSALNAAQFPKHTALQWLIAIPIAFLSTAYIAPKEVMSILTAYTALGVTLSVIVPFVIMIFFSAMLLSHGKTTIGKVMLQVFLWLLFGVVLLYKLIAGWASGEVSVGMNITFLAMFTIFIIVFGIFVFNKKFRTWVMKLGIEIRWWEKEYEKLSAQKAVDMAETVQAGGTASIAGAPAP